MHAGIILVLAQVSTHPNLAGDHLPARHVLVLPADQNQAEPSEASLDSPTEEPPLEGEVAEPAPSKQDSPPSTLPGNPELVQASAQPLKAPPIESWLPGSTPPPEIVELPELYDAEPLRGERSLPFGKSSPVSEAEDVNQDPPTESSAASRASASSNLPPSSEIAPRLLDDSWPQQVRERFVGSVLVEVYLDDEGTANAVNLLEGTGQPAWDVDLVRFFRQASYAPGTTRGKPVECTHRFRVTFRKR